jgi:hypothetical protein
MQFWYDTIWAEESGGNNFTETFTVNGIDAPILAQCYLQEVNGGGNSKISITAYVSGGTPHENIDLQVLQGNEVTSVTFTLLVNNASARGVGMVLAIDE